MLNISSIFILFCYFTVGYLRFDLDNQIPISIYRKILVYLFYFHSQVCTVRIEYSVFILRSLVNVTLFDILRYIKVLL